MNVVEKGFVTTFWVCKRVFQFYGSSIRLDRCSYSLLNCILSNSQQIPVYMPPKSSPWKLKISYVDIRRQTNGLSNVLRWKVMSMHDKNAH